MDIISWTPALKLGHELIDSQHQHFVSLVSQFQKAVLVDKDSDRIVTLIDEVIDYAHIHFKTEEDLMKANNYEHYLHHKNLHDTLLKELNDKTSLMNRMSNSYTNLIIFLYKWFIEHTSYVDVKLALFLNEKN